MVVVLWVLAILSGQFDLVKENDLAERDTGRPPQTEDARL
jgi:hypothetical protein